MPSCRECNGKYGKLEADLLCRLGLCVSPAEAMASGISAKALRAIDPKFAKNKKDRRHRQAKRERIYKDLLQFEQLPPYGILPGFGPKPTQKRFLGITVPEQSLRLLVIKVVKGMTYLLDRRLLDESYEVEYYFIKDEDAKQIVALLNKYGSKFTRGPGIAVTMAVPHDGPKVALFLIEIWGRFKAYATVAPTGLLDDGKSQASQPNFALQPVGSVEG